MSGLYIHIPFCHSKCIYCDFYSGLPPRMAEGYIDALLQEFELRKSELPSPIQTIYIGGGTPSSLPPNLLSQLRNLPTLFGILSPPVEYTLEANPDDITPDFLDLLKSLGVNRISMGVQAFDDNMLRKLNRRHSVTQALTAIKLLQDGGWNFSIDLMFGLPGQSLQMWQQDVDLLMDIHPPHFSAYLLSYEPGTRLYAMLQANKVEEASEMQSSMMQSYINLSAKNAGYQHYEISNYALPGFHSHHNSAYWTLTPYLGLGASAHSFDGRVRRFNPSDLKQYMSKISQGCSPAIIEEETDNERFNDWLITGLRTSRGLSTKNLREQFPEAYTELIHDATPLISSGQLILEENNLRIPEEYWLKSDAIMRDLIRI